MVPTRREAEGGITWAAQEDAARERAQERADDQRVFDGMLHKVAGEWAASDADAHELYRTLRVIAAEAVRHPDLVRLTTDPSGPRGGISHARNEPAAENCE